MTEKNHRKLGGRYEEQTARWLKERGCRILERNYRCRMGEIDLIAAQKHRLLFVEVKYRSDDRCGTPEEAVNPEKQHRIARAAQLYLSRHPEFWDWDCRFDVAAFRADGGLQYYPGAFGGI